MGLNSSDNKEIYNKSGEEANISNSEEPQKMNNPNIPNKNGSNSISDNSIQSESQLENILKQNFSRLNSEELIKIGFIKIRSLANNSIDVYKIENEKNKKIISLVPDKNITWMSVNMKYTPVNFKIKFFEKQPGANKDPIYVFLDLILDSLDRKWTSL